MEGLLTDAVFPKQIPHKLLMQLHIGKKGIHFKLSTKFITLAQFQTSICLSEQNVKVENLT